VIRRLMGHDRILATAAAMVGQFKAVARTLR
jgi:hypothetical protein